MPPEKRPRTRGECVDGPRPCPWVSCRFHILVETIRYSPFGNKRDQKRFLEKLEELVEEDLLGMEDTCALDVADEGPQTLEAIGKMMGMTRERVRQIETQALLRARRRGLELKTLMEDD